MKEKGFEEKTGFKLHTEFGEWTLPNDLSSPNFSLLVQKMEKMLSLQDGWDY